MYNEQDNDGYQTSPSAMDPMTTAPAQGAPAQPMSQEQRLGRTDFNIWGDARLASPEDANADYGLVPPVIHNAAAVAQVPFAIPVQGNFTKVRADYNIISNYQYARDGAAVVNALGRNDQDEVVATNSVATEFVMTTPATPNFVLGFFLEWSLQVLSSSAFTMEVVTTGFKGLSWNSVDRSFAIRIASGSRANGGIIGVVFAQRLTAQDKCGAYGYNSGSPQTAYGGMQKAIVQPAWIAPYGVARNGTPDPDEVYPVEIPGLTNWDRTPTVKVTVPAAIASGFSVLARYITAGSPQMADLRQVLRLATA